MIQNWISEIEAVPNQMRALVEPLSEEELNKTYRPEGWTIRQVVHHVFDSHINAFIRFKWSLTEDNPTIKAYHEDRWAELSDSAQTPVDVSLNGLAALHFRWSVLMRAMDEEQFKRTFFHPQSKQSYGLEAMAGMYAWHGKHHLEHIKIALK